MGDELADRAGRGDWAGREAVVGVWVVLRAMMDAQGRYRPRQLGQVVREGHTESAGPWQIGLVRAAGESGRSNGPASTVMAAAALQRRCSGTRSVHTQRTQHRGERASLLQGGVMALHVAGASYCCTAADTGCGGRLSTYMRRHCSAMENPAFLTSFLCCSAALLALHLTVHRDEQLAKFEAYLNKEGCLNINCIVRPRSRMAYPMKKK